jgi:long-chain acyl-CoA synthetase
MNSRPWHRYYPAGMPQEITLDEAVVAMMPEVLECACVGIPDERSGEAPHLFAVARAPEQTAAKIEAHCRANLAGYKVPRRISLVDSLPKSTVGKILRRELRQQAVQASAE